MKKNQAIKIKVSTEEKKIIETKAKSLGLTASAFLRAVGLKANIIAT